MLVRGVHATFRSALPGMLEQGSGSLIAIASQLAFVAIPRWVAYTAAKAALLGLVRGYALDFGRRGIRCNALCPGPTRTAMTERQLEGEPDPEATLPEWSRGIPLARFARPDEIAAGAVFLASEESSFMTGSALVIDGGITGS